MGVKLPKRSEAHDKNNPARDHHHSYGVRQMHRLAETGAGKQLRATRVNRCIHL